MTLTEKRQSLKPTCLEQSFDLKSSDYTYEWAEKFVNFCIEKMGWEVVPGPGTSLGAIVTPSKQYDMVSSYGQEVVGDTHYWGEYGTGLQGWDCDWTQVDGLVSEIKDLQNIPVLSANNGVEFSNTTTINSKVWFQNFRLWNGKTDIINEVESRFDFIIYLGENNNGQKIGLRFKYPVCSVGYGYISIPSVQAANSLIDANILYTTPIVTIYNSVENDMGQLYTISSHLQNNLTSKKEDELYKLQLGKFYALNNKKGYFNKINIYRKFAYYGDYTCNWDKSIESRPPDSNPDTSYPGASITAYGIQYDCDRTYGPPSQKIYYQISKSKETQYLHFNEMSLIVTSLEDGEQVVMILSKDNYLCEFYGTTTSYKVGLQQGKIFLKAIKSFFNSVQINDDNDFVLQRMLIPGQRVLCKELYYITHYPPNFIQSESYPYIYAKNEEGIWGCYRIVEVGENGKWKLAFPIVTPKEELGYES